ncbi:DUF1996 domain-containing protein [Actinacidiphila oryziradicis]|uniref:DUF1996 domain-containing protein n=1 Tax=Actinacidiphila oryziradicis TaxID=2571141 RepID=UPI0023F08467|nr:DUF1996 domain-containing protein [Actinacidiphila oryziradicis]MCW2875388.1 hypothetical protein [Actinacidiphila oryziradicis]
MSKRQSYDRRRRLSSKHLVLIAVLAVFGAGGTFAMVNGTANAALRHNGRQHGHTNKNQGGNNAGAGTGAGASASASASAGASASASAPAGGTGQAGARANGPVDADFVDITTVTPNVVKPQKLAGATTGSFVAQCGKNENKHLNPDNFIVAPGVSNGAQHTHDYVGNLTTDGFSTNQTLAAGGTTCANNDKSAYFWPVLRNLSANDQPGADNNTGTILTADSVTIKFKGSANSQVTAMPETLKVITGDAKALTNGTGNAKAQWSCTGFEDKVQLTDKYPLCPNGSKVVRTLDFPSCWDGVNTDSANHRTHIVFPDGAGQCQAGFKAVPALEYRLVYTVAAGPNFAVDSFPDQNHKPVTDHADFANFTGATLMNQIVGCINSGKNC